MKPPSRQLLWQRRNKLAGLCIICASPAHTKLHCQAHAAQHKARCKAYYHRKKLEAAIAPAVLP